ncbi:hypothetical protein CAI21_00050 [Alkalilimnicola ehrlichii]|uniref:OmpA-like domain-containing protein n=1 Tax=Alkalilimnicola ehrlichii TaxID=351052 RepID=A0A3E0X438_9GAMM|nr:OmpA family protein [Alkalilimnicola ehrlichii]RFA31102.1 hypothetical protein CAI21_00050 [Alkalilimnicola ehrlichii]RFA39610.1 hypothetical protein CAL65_02355 [Alkalilimnicola ehrlichii]
MAIGRWCMSLLLVTALMGCATQTPQGDELAKARLLVSQAEGDSAVAQYAPVALNEAKQQLHKAQQAAEGRRLNRAAELAQLAQQYAQIALMEAAHATAREDREATRNRFTDARVGERDQEIARFRSETDAALEQVDSTQAQLASMQPRRTARGLILTLDEVQFGFDSAALKSESLPSINRLARYLEAHPEQTVRIEGHTDSIGAASYNLRLSERRAQAVRAALIEEGIEPERIQAVGIGEERPIATNDTDAGRAQNRRVEAIVAINEDHPPEPQAARQRDE